MEKFKKILGYLWAAPVTLFGLYAFIFGLLGWYKWQGIYGDGLVWTVKQDTAPKWLLSLWKEWAGHGVGNVVVLKRETALQSSTLTHELRHVSQCMRLGVFQPIVYAICMLAIKLGCPGTDSYSYVPFEVDARRHAGQEIDVTSKEA